MSLSSPPRPSSRPPLLARFLVAVFATREVRDAVLEGLTDRFTDMDRLDSGAAKRWYWAQAIRCLSPSFRLKVGSRRRLASRQTWTQLVGGSLLDLRFAARSLSKRPGFFATAVLTLGVGIGATTAIFSVVNGVLLRPLPYPNAERLVNVWQVNHDWFDSPNPALRSWASSFPLSMPVLRDWEELSPAFQSVGVYDDRRFTVSDGGRPEMVNGTHLTSGVWRALGVSPFMGRFFSPVDDEVGAPPVAVLGFGYWERRYGGDPSVVGTTIRLNEANYTIVGVMPRGFYFPSTGNSSVWATFTDEDKADSRDSQFLTAIARLKPEITIPRAQREMEVLTERLVENRGHNPDHGVRIVSRIREVVGDVQLILFVLLGAVGVVLLIACANIANMLLVRATERRRELAIRSAMGAWRGRLLRQVLNESLLLSMVGGLAGGLLAIATFKPLLALLPPGVPRVDEITLDYRVLIFTGLVSVVTGLMAGSLPALRAARTDVAEMLQDGGRGVTGGRRRNRTQALLVVSEVALAFVLLFGAGLLIKSFIRLTSVDRGFNAESVLVFGLGISPEALALPSRSASGQPPGPTPEREQVVSYVRRLEERLGAIPGVQLVATADNMPFMGGTSSSTTTIESSSGIHETNLERSAVTPPYFRAMGVPIVRGRGFTDADGPETELVTIVSRATAEGYWPGEDPVGQRLRLGSIDSEHHQPWRTVVGVAEDVHHQGLDVDPRPKMYMPFSQLPRTRLDVILKARVAPDLIVAAAREAVAEVDPTVPPPNIRELENVVYSSVAAPRFRTRLISLFALVAGLLAVIGVYGVLAYSMAQRTAEIGVRIALGASTGDVVKSVLRRGAAFAAVGLAIGMAITLAAVRVLDSFLFETSVHDPSTFALVSLLLAVAALGASYVPARRATRVDPVEALRTE
jgi:putative ABC transport system permease protein